MNADDLEPCLVMSVRGLWQRPMSHVTEPQLHDDDDNKDDDDEHKELFMWNFYVNLQ